MLIANYYTILSREQIDEQTYMFRFTINPEADVYRGHFPGNPIAPGVCSLQMIKECLLSILCCETLQLSFIKQCRFSRLLRPSIQERQLIIRLLENHWVSVEMVDAEQVCMKLKAQYN